MLTMLFLTCAVVGGALVLAQLLLSIVAFGAGHGLHLHHQHGGSAAGDHGTVSRGIHRLRGSTRPHAYAAGGTGEQRALDSAAPHMAAPQADSGHSALGWVPSLFNFQGIVSGATVLGLAGLAATAAKLPGVVALAIAIGAALVMMAVIEGLFGVMANMDSDGTIDIDQAVGKMATVYLGIPAKSEGQGKITVSLQQRLMEFPAITLQDAPLVTGQKVIVVAVQDSDVMQVVSAEKYLPDLEV